MSESDTGPRAGPDAGASAQPARPRNSAAGSGPEPDRGTDGSGDSGSASAEAAARIAELEDQRLRALAELDNVRKRCASQVSRTEAEAQARVARQWLPVVDNLELALKHAEADPGSIVQGIKAVREQAIGVLAQLGFARREDLGASFDPTRHEAVASRVDPAAPEGSVIEVLRPGYGDGDSQLRPAQVIVAKAE
jgi:molecular chaperone GrpE